MSTRILLVKPTTVRRCIYCHLPITFGWLEVPIPASRRNTQPVAMLYAHPTPDACDEERARRQTDANPHDIGVQRARLLDELDARLKAAHAQHATADPKPVRRNGRARTRKPAHAAV